MWAPHASHPISYMEEIYRKLDVKYPIPDEMLLEMKSFYTPVDGRVTLDQRLFFKNPRGSTTVCYFGDAIRTPDDVLVGCLIRSSWEGERLAPTVKQTSEHIYELFADAKPVGTLKRTPFRSIWAKQFLAIRRQLDEELTDAEREFAEATREFAASQERWGEAEIFFRKSCMLKRKRDLL